MVPGFAGILVRTHAYTCYNHFFPLRGLLWVVKAAIGADGELFRSSFPHVPQVPSLTCGMRYIFFLKAAHLSSHGKNIAYPFWMQDQVSHSVCDPTEGFFRSGQLNGPAKIAAAMPEIAQVSVVDISCSSVIKRTILVMEKRCYRPLNSTADAHHS